MFALINCVCFDQLCLLFRCKTICHLTSGRDSVCAQALHEVQSIVHEVLVPMQWAVASSNAEGAVD